MSTLRQAILLDPRNPNLYVDFANIAFAHQSFQVGIDVVTDGIGLQPQAAPLYLARGVLYVQLAEYDKAEADFEKANRLDPSQSLSSAAQGLADVLMGLAGAGGGVAAGVVIGGLGYAALASGAAVVGVLVLVVGAARVRPADPAA